MPFSEYMPLIEYIQILIDINVHAAEIKTYYDCGDQSIVTIAYVEYFLLVWLFIFIIFILLIFVIFVIFILFYCFYFLFL